MQQKSKTWWSLFCRWHLKAVGWAVSRAMILGNQVLARGKRLVKNRASPEVDRVRSDAEKLWTSSEGKLLLFSFTVKRRDNWLHRGTCEWGGKAFFYTKGRGKKAFWTLWSLFLLCVSLNISVSVGLSCWRIWPKSAGPEGLCNCLGSSVQGFWHARFQSGAESFALQYPVLHAFSEYGQSWKSLNFVATGSYWDCFVCYFCFWAELSAFIDYRGCAFGPAVLVGTLCALEPSQSRTHLLPSAPRYFQLS